jgi:uncharacterized membrane protein
MHKQRTSAQTKRSATYAPRSSVAVAFLLLVAFFRAILVLLVAVTALRVLVLVLLVAILATLLATVALARRRPAAFAGLLVDVEVALLAVIPAGDPWVK